MQRCDGNSLLGNSLKYYKLGWNALLLFFSFFFYRRSPPSGKSGDAMSLRKTIAACIETIYRNIPAFKMPRNYGKYSPGVFMTLNVVS